MLKDLKRQIEGDLDSEEFLMVKREIASELPKDLKERREDLACYLSELSPHASSSTERMFIAAIESLIDETEAAISEQDKPVKRVQTVHRANIKEDMGSLWEEVSKINEKVIKDALDMPYFDTTIHDKGPIAISFISDHHVAPYAPCDLKKMAEDAALIASTPGAYAILGGDGVDNHIKHHNAVLVQESTPDMQWKLYDHYLSLLNVDDSILVMISGNHDDWTMDFAGVDMLSRLADKHKIHYAPDEAYINLTLGSQKYVIAMRHKYMFNSSFNLGNTVKKWYDQGKMPFDIGCIGHHHEAHYEIFHKHGEDRVALRPGSYQISSPYTRRNGFNPARPVAPTVVIWGDHREIMVFKDVKQGVEYLSYLRGKAGLD